MKKKLAGVALVLAAVSLMSIQPVEACTRAVYIGPDQMVVTGRTMDWKEDIMTNIYVFPRGIQRMGHNKEKTVNWTSKYGSVLACFSCRNPFTLFPAIPVRQWASAFGHSMCLITLPRYAKRWMN